MNPALNSPATKASRSLTENRRRGNRHRLHIPATLVPDGDHPSPIPVIVTEVSIGGVGFRATCELPLEGAYRLNSFDTLIPPEMRVHIVSQRKLSDGSFAIGAKGV